MSEDPIVNETATHDAPKTREGEHGHSPDAEDSDEVMIDAWKTFALTVISVGLFIGVVIAFVLF